MELQAEKELNKVTKKELAKGINDVVPNIRDIKVAEGNNLRYVNLCIEGNKIISVLIYSSLSDQFLYHSFIGTNERCESK